MYTVDIHSCPGYAFRLSERSFRLFIRRPVYRSVRSASDSGFSGFRGAALNQSRSASGVYTGLIC
ncbi:hypothetical protein D0W60_23885 [Salmonella enterica]|nr:hypothetical protein [Salmonella enterica]EBE2411244.1 hypothetical protein [Salmonella enterica]